MFRLMKNYKRSVIDREELYARIEEAYAELKDIYSEERIARSTRLTIQTSASDALDIACGMANDCTRFAETTLRYMWLDIFFYPGIKAKSDNARKMAFQANVYVNRTSALLEAAMGKPIKPKLTVVKNERIG